MKKNFYCVLSLIVVLCLMLWSCSEDEPLPSGVSGLPDLTVSELAESLTDDSGVMQWPSKMLPDGFPVPKYTEIYSVEREENEVRIVLFGKKTSTSSDGKSFMLKLYNAGWSPYDDPLTGLRYICNTEGYRVTIAESDSWTGVHLHSVNEKSPTGYTFEIKVRQTGIPMDCLFWKFPDANTDLGLESIVFEKWPTDYLPEHFPRPNENIEILEMKQEKNGLFITLKGVVQEVTEYMAEVHSAMGYINSSEQPYRNPDGDYMYYKNLEYNFSGQSGDAIIVTDQIQICPANDMIIK